MKGIVKRNKFSIPYWIFPPKMTYEYGNAMDNLYFGKNIAIFNSSELEGNICIVPGNPTMLKEQVNAIGKFIENFNFYPNVITTGGVSPGYSHFFEAIGIFFIELFKGTFGFDIKQPEATRLANRLNKKYPQLSVIQETKSKNLYENMEYAYGLLKRIDCLEKIVIVASAEALPRAIETFKTVMYQNADNYDIVGMPINPELKDKWHKSLWWRGRFEAERLRLMAYSDPKNTRLKKRIELSEEAHDKLINVEYAVAKHSR